MLALPHSSDWRRRRPCSQRLILDHAKHAEHAEHAQTRKNSPFLLLSLFFCCVSCLLDNQQHLRTDTHHTVAVEFNRQNQNKRFFLVFSVCGVSLPIGNSFRPVKRGHLSKRQHPSAWRFLEKGESATWPHYIYTTVLPTAVSLLTYVSGIARARSRPPSP